MNIVFRISSTMNAWIIQYMLAREDNAYRCDDHDDEESEAEAEDENHDEADDEDEDDDDEGDE